jgi:hypothetical protein
VETCRAGPNRNPIPRATKQLEETGKSREPILTSFPSCILVSAAVFPHFSAANAVRIEKSLHAHSRPSPTTFL